MSFSEQETEILKKPKTDLVMYKYKKTYSD